MTKDKLFALITTSLISALVLLVGGYIAGYYQGKIDEQKSLSEKHSLNQERLTHALSDWVYANSDRISRDTSEKIVTECLKTDKPLLLLALIKTESEFIPNAVSKQGAIGLTQVMFNHHGKALINQGILKDKRELFDIATSIKAGNYIFSLMLKENGDDVIKAFNSYLGGTNETYLKRILTTLGTLYLLTEANHEGNA